MEMFAKYFTKELGSSSLTASVSFFFRATNLGGEVFYKFIIIYMGDVFFVYFNIIIGPPSDLFFQRELLGNPKH